MNRRACLTAAWVALVVVGGARGQFKAGNVFVTEPTSKHCTFPEFFTWDRIWEIDPNTGEVTLFAELQDELCGRLTGAVFTPDGKRLRVAQVLNSRVLELDWQGNVSIALERDDGIVGPWDIMYDVDDNFYVLNGNSTIVRFPADGGPGTIFVDESDGIMGNGPMAFAADGDLYFGKSLGTRELLRITPDGDVSVFRTYELNDRVTTLTADAAGFLYVGLSDSTFNRYVAGDPGSKELLASDVCFLSYKMAMSPDQRSIYLTCALALVAIDVKDGAITHLGDIPQMGIDLPGIAVAPPQFIPVPSASEWGIIGMTLTLLTVGTLVLARRSRAARVANPPLASSKQFRGRSECASDLQPDLQLGFRVRVGGQD